MKEYKIVIFDFDGTVADSYESNAGTAKMVLDRNGLTLPKGAVYGDLIGPPLAVTFERWFPDMPEEERDGLIAQFRELFAGRSHLCEIYPGMTELLAGLRERGTLVGMASMKRQVYMASLLDKLGLSGYFDCVRGRDPAAGIVTKAETIGVVLDMAGLEAGQALLVGDSEYDMQGALECGMDFVAVYYGYGFRHEAGREAPDERCVYKAETVGELSGFLLGQK